MIIELSHYRNLEVYNSKDNADSVLLGIVDSENKISETSRTVISTYIEGDLKEATIGNRPSFSLPLTSSYKLKVRFLLIKNPKKKKAKILLDKFFDFQGSFTRILDSTRTADSLGINNFTKTDYNFRKSLDTASESLIQNFKNVVLDVF